MRYVDTSILLALFLTEAKTPAAWAWLAGLQGLPLYVSHWNVTEFSSALGVKARMRLINEPNRQQILADFRRLSRARLAFVSAEPEDFQRAADLCDQWSLNLRAGDALHVAIAERYGWTICSLDKPMLDAAEKIGLSVETF